MYTIMSLEESQIHTIGLRARQQWKFTHARTNTASVANITISIHIHVHVYIHMYTLHITLVDWLIVVHWLYTTKPFQRMSRVCVCTHMYMYMYYRWGHDFPSWLSVFHAFSNHTTATLQRGFSVGNIIADHVTYSQSHALKVVTWSSFKSRNAHFSMQ